MVPTGELSFNEVHMTVTNDVKYVGVNDRSIDLFEGQYSVPNGISYNSYMICDEKTAVLDTVDAAFGAQWLENIKVVLGDKTPDYLIIQHMEPDHSANIMKFKETYPESRIVTSQKALVMIKNFFGVDMSEESIVVAEGTVLSLGRHELTFVAAPMVHWPEVMVTYDSTDKILFSADGFGKFGTPDTDEGWDDEARRYYIGIVGKYGAQVQALLKKAAKLDIEIICPLHGPVLREEIPHCIGLYDKWSSYTPEKEGVLIAYTSVYGNTAVAARKLYDIITEKGVAAEIFDLARCDTAEAVAKAFLYSKTVLVTTTYNGEAFPAMREFINHLTERNFSNRTVAFVENGSWAPVAAKAMKAMLEKSKNLTYAENTVKIMSALNEESTAQLCSLAQELCM